MSEALRRAVEAAERAAWAVVDDPCPYGEAYTPELERLGAELDAALTDLLALLPGEERLPGIGPRDLADWARERIDRARADLGLGLGSYWPTHV